MACGGSDEVVGVALFFLLGVGSLLPWNAFITESAYFQARLRGTPMEDTFESAFGLAYNGANLLALLTLLVVQQFFSEATLIVAPYLLVGAVFALMAALALVQLPSPEFLFELTMACVVLAGLLAAPMIAGVTGLASKFPRDWASSFFSGQAFAGVMASVTSWITTASAPLKDDFCKPAFALAAAAGGGGASNSSSGGGGGGGGEDDDAPAHGKDYAAFAYFLVAAVFSVVCIAGYVGVKALERKRNGLHSSVTRTLSTALLDEPFTDFEQTTAELFADAATVSAAPNNLDPDQDPDRLADLLVQDGGATAEPPQSATETSLDDLEEDEYVRRALSRLPATESWAAADVARVAAVIRWPALAVLLTYWVTLSVFPAVTAATVSSRHCTPDTARFWNDLFVPTLFFLFNISDLAGRVVQARWQPFNGTSLFWLSVGRLLLLPVFWGMRVNESRLAQPFKNDVFPLVISLIAGFSNGYVGTAGMVHASRLVPMVHRDVASTVAVTSLTLGLLLGSVSSFGTMWLIQG